MYTLYYCCLHRKSLTQLIKTCTQMYAQQYCCLHRSHWVWGTPLGDNMSVRQEVAPHTVTIRETCKQGCSAEPNRDLRRSSSCGLCCQTQNYCHSTPLEIRFILQDDLCFILLLAEDQTPFALRLMTLKRSRCYFEALHPLGRPGLQSDCSR